MADELSSGPAIFSSLYRHGVDDKRRVQIPAKWRPRKADATFTLLLWKKGGNQGACLLALPPEVMQDLMERLKSMPFSDSKAEALRRSLGTNADQVILDKAGRICLPEKLAQAAGIEAEAVLVGMFDRFQIWEPERYDAASSLDDDIYDEAIQMI